MHLPIRLGYWLSSRKRISAKTSNPEEVWSFVRRFRPIKISIPLTRLGSDNDGGYLIPDDFGGVVACFSPGVSTNTSFETSLLEKYNVPSYLTDPTLTANQRDEIDKIFDLEDKYLGGCNDRDMFDLENWMQIKGYGACTNYSLVLQMDIEGYEFDVLLATPERVLQKFRYLVVEFHEIEKWNEKHYFESIRAGLTKLFTNFESVHFHPNNHNQYGWLHGHLFPKCFEVTLVNKEFAEKCCGFEDGFAPEPHPLDQPNNPDKPDIHTDWDIFPQKYYR